MNIIIKKIKKWLSIEKVKNFQYTCECGQVFEGRQIELFIKHQIDFKHFRFLKTRKTDPGNL